LTHEPLIIAGAEIPNGRSVEEITEMVDLVPIVLQLCCIGEHFAHNGMSLLPAILATSPHKEYTFSEGGFLISEESLVENATRPYDPKANFQHGDN
jgi:hypothetical protein